MDDKLMYLIGTIVTLVGLGIAFTGGSMGQGAENYYIGLFSYIGGFVLAFIGVGILAKVYQRRK